MALVSNLSSMCSNNSAQRVLTILKYAMLYHAMSCHDCGMPYRPPKSHEILMFVGLQTEAKQCCDAREYLTFSNALCVILSLNMLGTAILGREYFRAQF